MEYKSWIWKGTKILIACFILFPYLQDIPYKSPIKLGMKQVGARSQDGASLRLFVSGCGRWVAHPMRYITTTCVLCYIYIYNHDQSYIYIYIHNHMYIVYIYIVYIYIYLSPGRLVQSFSQEQAFFASDKHVASTRAWLKAGSKSFLIVLF